MYKVAQAEELPTFNIDTGSLISDALSMTNNLISELFPVIALIVGVLLGFLIISLIVSLFTDSKN